MLKNKTVRKRFISKILFLLALFIVVCIPASFAAVASCTGNTGTSGTRYGTINGTCYAYYCKDETMTKLGGVNSSQCANCSGVKYAPSGNCGTCEYKCCSDGNWSGCNQECPDPSAACSSSQCWDGSKCANQPSGKQYNGKCYFTYSGCTCNKGTGWSCNKNYYLQDGAWTTTNSQRFNNNGSIASGRLCSTKVSTSSSASSSCTTQGASLRGIPYEAMEPNVEEGSCFIVSLCQCGNNPSKTFTDPSAVGSVCGSTAGSFYCSGKTLSCYAKSQSDCE